MPTLTVLHLAAPDPPPVPGALGHIGLQATDPALCEASPPLSPEPSGPWVKQGSHQ